MTIAKNCGGNKLLYNFFKEYELESKSIEEKYSSRPFKWYQKRQQAIIHRIPFSESQPSHNVTEAIEKRKKTTAEVFSKIGDKSGELAHKLDQKIQESKTFGGFWKKLTGKQNEDNDLLEQQQNDRDEEEKTPDLTMGDTPDDMSHDDY